MTSSTEEFSPLSSASPISSDLPMPDQVLEGSDRRVRPASQLLFLPVEGIASVTFFDGEWSGDPISSVEFVDEESARSGKGHRAVRLLESWLEDESGYDEETWPELKERLDEDRPSSRPLFP